MSITTFLFRAGVYMLVIGCLGLLSANVYSPGFWWRMSGWSIHFVIVGILALLGVWRLLYRLPIGTGLFRIVYGWLFPTWMLLGGVLIVIDLYVYYNFVYGLLHVSPFEIYKGGFWIGIMGLLLLSKETLNYKWREVLLLLPLLAYQALCFYWFFPYKYFGWVKEDGPVEYLTFGTYVIATVCSGLALYGIMKVRTQFKDQLQWWVLVVFLGCLTMFMGLVSGEEISWGQRIVGFETPDAIRDANTQYEFNLHNNRAVFDYVYLAYGAVNLFGLVGWVFTLVGKVWLPKWWRPLLEVGFVPWFLSLWFVPNLVYVIVRTRESTAVNNMWEELSELYLAVGLCIWCGYIWRSSRLRFGV